jgi:hypothetical protein
MRSDDGRACDCCGQPAAFRMKTNPREERCELCAVRYGYERVGEAYGAVKTLVSQSLCCVSAIDDSTIVAIVHEVLHRPHSDGDYPIGGDHLIGPDRIEDRPWTAPFVAITGEAR